MFKIGDIVTLSAIPFFRGIVVNLSEDGTDVGVKYLTNTSSTRSRYPPSKGMTNQYFAFSLIKIGCSKIICGK